VLVSGTSTSPFKSVQRLRLRLQAWPAYNRSYSTILRLMYGQCYCELGLVGVGYGVWLLTFSPTRSLGKRSLLCGLEVTPLVQFLLAPCRPTLGQCYWSLLDWALLTVLLQFHAIWPSGICANIAWNYCSRLTSHTCWSKAFRGAFDQDVCRYPVLWSIQTGFSCF
jgi:hypothetical protein